MASRRLIESLQAAPETDRARLSAELQALLGAPVARTTAIAAGPEAAEKTLGC